MHTDFICQSRFPLDSFERHLDDHTFPLTVPSFLPSRQYLLVPHDCVRSSSRREAKTVTDNPEERREMDVSYRARKLLATRTSLPRFLALPGPGTDLIERVRAQPMSGVLLSALTAKSLCVHDRSHVRVRTTEAHGANSTVARRSKDCTIVVGQRRRRR